MQLAQCDEALWHYNHPNSHANVAFDTLLPHVQQPFGLYHICTKLYQLLVTKLRSLQKEAVDTKTYIPNSPENKLGPVVQSVVSLTSSLRVNSLTILADSMYNILIFFAEKM